MITLQAPVTIVVNSITIPANPQYYIVDNSESKTVAAVFKGLQKPMILWAGADYDSIGNWTQEQADARIIEILGSNPAEVFTSMLVLR
jgi:ABC-type phosphate transport system substrate-binding protein